MPPDPLDELVQMHQDRFPLLGEIGGMKKSRPVLCATDFSTASRPALAEAIELAKSRKAPLLITHVLVTPSPVALEGSMFPQGYRDLEASICADAGRRLDAAASRARKAGLAVTTRLVRGIPHEEILKLARKNAAAAIVVGTHGRTGVSRLVVGSVATRLVAAATVPVLTVRGGGLRRP